MKNNISYEEAVSKFKELSAVQKYMKMLRTGAKGVEDHKVVQENLRRRKVELNYLLSIVAAHKTARKLFNEVQELSDEK